MLSIVTCVYHSYPCEYKRDNIWVLVQSNRIFSTTSHIPKYFISHATVTT